MRNDDAPHIASIGAMLARQRPDFTNHRIGKDAAELFKLALGCAACSVAMCNDPITPRQKRTQERRAAKLAEIAKEYGATVSTGGDPRGYVVRLHIPGAASNTFDGDGFGIA